MNVPEYNLADPSTWRVIRERDVISESEDARFQDELIRIAGLNPHGKPNLIRIWAVSYIDPMSEDGNLKYFLCNNDPTLIGFAWGDNFTKRLEDVPADVIALPKYNNEKLGERRHVIEVWRDPAFLKASGRYGESIRRDDDGEILLREFPRQGCYDHFLRLETEAGLYHPADAEALEGIRRLWNYQQKSLAEREIDSQKVKEQAARQVVERRDEIWATS